jgi:hypothetical protein
VTDWDDGGEDDDAPPLDTEEGRDAWIEFLLSQDDGEEEWAKAMVVQADDNMVVRFRWPDGREEVYDLKIRRSMEVVPAKDDVGSN